VFARDISFELPEDYPKQNPNEVFLNGYICKPPVYRTTPFGREIADILIAVNRSYNKSDYIPCIAWGRNARFASKLTIGENIRIWGRMQSRPYQKKTDDGQVFDKVAYEVSISKIEYAGVNELHVPSEDETPDDFQKAEISEQL
jgi:single-stranded DNA-binding protein